jgi:hypothetical protein
MHWLRGREDDGTQCLVNAQHVAKIVTDGQVAVAQLTDGV